MVGQEQPTFRRRFSELTAAPMFWIALIFLANIATLIVARVDVPRVSEAAKKYRAANPMAVGEAPAFDEAALAVSQFSVSVALVLWPIFFIELLIYLFAPGGERRVTRSRAMGCLCPPLRLAAANPEMDGRIWLPGAGWTLPNEESRDRLAKIFGLPMLLVALLIVPVLLLEFGFKEQINSQLWLRALLHLCTGVIWFAFAVEFVLMVSFAAKKFRYCKDNWVDLAIIMLPLVSFLRSFRFVKATRLARLAQVQHLGKMGRTYRLRGLVVKTLRAVLLFEVLYSVLGISPERRIKGLREKLDDKEREVANLKRQIALLEETIAAKAAAKEAAFTTEDVTQ